MNLVPTKSHSNGTGTTGITVLRRDSGAACRIRTCGQPLRRRLLYPTELMPQRKEHWLTRLHRLFTIIGSVLLPVVCLSFQAVSNSVTRLACRGVWIVQILQQYGVYPFVDMPTHSLPFPAVKRALITTVDHPAREVLLPPVLSSLHPRLFRGVTPDRHDGESHVTHTENADLHIPATRLGNREPARTASTHVPYVALLVT